MTQWEKRQRAWFRAHGWRTQSGTGYGEVWLFNENRELRVHIDPIMDDNAINIHSYGKSGCQLTIEELRRICEILERNASALEEVRLENKKKEGKSG